MHQLQFLKQQELSSELENVILFFQINNKT